MRLQVKILLFCLSLVLMSRLVAPKKTPAPNKPQPTIPDITVEKCNDPLKPQKISVKATKAGNYYQCTDYSKLERCTSKGTSDGKTASTFDIDKAQNGKTYLVRFDLVMTNQILTGEFDKYEVDCNFVKKVTATGKISVKSKGKDSKAHLDNNNINKKVDIKFNPTTNVNLGTPVTMTFEENNANQPQGEIKMIKVSKCSVKPGKPANGKPIPIFDANDANIGQELKIKKTTPKFEALEFNAFRLLKQDGDEITFDCEVYICSDVANCNIPPKKSPGPPQPYSASVGGGFDKVSGVLSVHIPQYLGSDVIPSSADKVCSYTNGFLLTVGAVVLQRQLMQN